MNDAIITTIQQALIDGESEAAETAARTALPEWARMYEEVKTELKEMGLGLSR